jgi:hypothetical protein
MSGIKTRTASTVQKLLDAGARFVGKTVTDELAFSMNGNNAHFGAPINGAAKDRITGGSSSGSASAVSSGLCDFAIGTDTGGSVRAPANHCGLYGLRPTHGRISLEGALDLAPSLDSCGWFARDIGTFARVGRRAPGGRHRGTAGQGAAALAAGRVGAARTGGDAGARGGCTARASRARAGCAGAAGGAGVLGRDVLELSLRAGA